MNYEITRTDFFYVMANLKTMIEDERKMREALKAEPEWIFSHWIDKYTDLLLRPFNEEQQDWIMMYVYDFDFGHSFHKGMLKDEDGLIRLRTASDLWELINDNPVHYKDPPEI